MTMVVATPLPYAFVCYSHSDREQAERIEQYLKQHGIKTWRDENDIPASADWRNEIQSALDHAHAMILLWSKAASESKEVQAEWNAAVNKYPIYIVLLDSTLLNYRLAQIQWTLNFDDLDTALPKLYQQLSPIFQGTSWIDRIPFLTKSERQFADFFNYLDIRWYYNTYPIHLYSRYPQPRFWILYLQDI